MRVLAHMHTMNDAAVIEQLLDGLRRQTQPIDAILIVDNASTDGTLDRAFPENVTTIRNQENLGTSGTVRMGFAHALEHGFDWVWIFDADSVPEPDALEKLLAFFERLPPDQRADLLGQPANRRPARSNSRRYV
jgi:GT2 family glycosyltransferase